MADNDSELSNYLKTINFLYTYNDFNSYFSGLISLADGAPMANKKVFGDCQSGTFTVWRLYVICHSAQFSKCIV